MTREENRQDFLNALRSGKYKKGTILSDENGFPIINSEGDDEGYCACAIMIDRFVRLGGKHNFKQAREALGITAKQCKYIQTELNDTELTFLEIADQIELKIFKSKYNG